MSREYRCKLNHEYAVPPPSYCSICGYSVVEKDTEADVLRKTIGEALAEQSRLEVEIRTLRHKALTRSAPPPVPYTTWDEHDKDQADKLHGELRARREPMQRVRAGG